MGLGGHSATTIGSSSPASQSDGFHIGRPIAD